MAGLGAMGHSVAANILKKGHPMSLFDIRPESYSDLIPLGGTPAASMAALGNCDLVLIMVNTFAQCESCLRELLTGMETGIVVICSTIQMKEVQQLEKMALKKGIRLLDAPVSGGTAGARNGTLTIMAAGPDEVYNDCLPILQCYGSHPLHVGPRVGQGQAIKAVNQLLVGIHICAAAEAFNMASRCGLDLQQVYDTIKISAGTSRIFENRGPFFLKRDFSTRSTLSIQLKDTDIACKIAADAGAPALLGNLCRQFYQAAVGKYPPTEDSIAVIQLLEELNSSSSTEGQH